jgi:hypothetical protein
MSKVLAYPLEECLRQIEDGLSSHTNRCGFRGVRQVSAPVLQLGVALHHNYNYRECYLDHSIRWRIDSEIITLLRSVLGENGPRK